MSNDLLKTLERLKFAIDACILALQAFAETAPEGIEEPDDVIEWGPIGRPPGTILGKFTTNTIKLHWNSVRGWCCYVNNILVAEGDQTIAEAKETVRVWFTRYKVDVRGVRRRADLPFRDDAQHHPVQGM